MRHAHSHLSDAELLGSADGELSGIYAKKVEAHLRACPSCRTRFTKLRNAMEELATEYRTAFNKQVQAEEWAEVRLRARLAYNTSLPSRISWPWRWAVLVLIVICLSKVSGHKSGIVPDPYLTPGEAAVVSRTAVCQANLQAGQQIPEALRRAVLEEYGVKDSPQSAYEIDFLITPELGGSASIRNLWPQPYGPRAWNAHVKDALEQRLHDMVCQGDLDLSTAQREISSNWVDAYKKYLRTDNPM